MRVCWTGTFVPEFERNKRLREYLGEAQAVVTVVREDIWPEDRVSAITNARLKMLLRMLLAYPKLAFRLLRSPAPDVYLVSYPGWFDLPIVWLVAWLKRRPIVFDVFISLFDTAVSDRKLIRESSIIAGLARLVDRVSMRLSDRVIADCPAHAEFLGSLAGVPPERIGVLYLGADETRFHLIDPRAMEPKLVVFYGTFVPLQGVEWIVRAGKILEQSGVRLRLIGDGQTKPMAERLATELGAQNIEFVGLMPQEQLLGEIGSASLVLGVFGITPKANRVVPHKLYEAIACGRPVLTAASDAVVGVLSREEVEVCEPGDEVAMADAIARLLAEPRRLREMAGKARRRFETDFALRPQAARLQSELSAASVRRRTFVRS